ncbi:hypothetical protein [Mumia zhuanghuii]|uniref:Uncharacterized protein n=1 Tax=Mumia zhuanghuii TaxID=2585211 RepID=A0A5C4LUZ6_9ACTN|nr:hypothetical protein [Mumia zhuanghuii]TNC22037.1 hypothetical protein FHE65_36190 [Mumia zhuanghuii]TNC22186.1 hypothetical protein FHE65_35905 [Mumia zhuanghuii]
MLLRRRRLVAFARRLDRARSELLRAARQVRDPGRRELVELEQWRQARAQVLTRRLWPWWWLQQHWPLGHGDCGLHLRQHEAQQVLSEWLRPAVRPRRAQPQWERMWLLLRHELQALLPAPKLQWPCRARLPPPKP